ncbi:MAG: hypothetical protein WCG34_04675 [Leptolinea sp.]
MEDAPEKLNAQAKAAYLASNFDSATSLYLEAEQAYKNSNDLLMATEMANNRSVALLQVGKAEAALQASEDTHLIFAEAGDNLREGYALGNQAAAFKELGQKNISLKLYKLSAEKLAFAGDKENLAVVQKTIATLEMEGGNPIKAMGAMLEALRSKEKLTMREKIMCKLFSTVSRLMP